MSRSRSAGRPTGLVTPPPINLGILVFTVVSAWLLMPRFGLLGVGIGWLAAQVLSALACIPAFLNLDGRAAA